VRFRGFAQMDEDEFTGFHSKHILRFSEDLRE